jgi:hypothetical protein
MSYSVQMIRRDGQHAVKVSGHREEAVYQTPWFSRPEDAVNDARSWMHRNWQDEAPCHNVRARQET